MKTKVIVVPTLIILSGYVTIGHIKPDFDTYMQKREFQKAAEENARQAQSIATNVGTLKTEMETQKEKVAFVQFFDQSVWTLDLKNPGRRN